MTALRTAEDANWISIQDSLPEPETTVEIRGWLGYPYRGILRRDGLWQVDSRFEDQANDYAGAWVDLERRTVAYPTHWRPVEGEACDPRRGGVARLEKQMNTYLFEIFYRDRDPARPTVICHVVPPGELDGYVERYLRMERVAGVGVAQVVVTKAVTYKSK